MGEGGGPDALPADVQICSGRQIKLAGVVLPGFASDADANSSRRGGSSVEASLGRSRRSRRSVPPVVFVGDRGHKSSVHKQTCCSRAP